MLDGECKEAVVILVGNLGAETRCLSHMHATDRIMGRQDGE